MMQESIWKDVERCFDVLQASFAIVQNPYRQWNVDTIANIMVACVISQT
jgi:hypothetical protein